MAVDHPHSGGEKIYTKTEMIGNPSVGDGMMVMNLQLPDYFKNLRKQNVIQFNHDRTLMEITDYFNALSVDYAPQKNTIKVEFSMHSLEQFFSSDGSKNIPKVIDDIIEKITLSSRTQLAIKLGLPKPE